MLNGFNIYTINIMRIFVISMDNEVGEKRRSLLNYDYEWIKSVEIPEELKDKFIFRYNTGEKHKKGVMGCFASHLYTLKKIIDEKIDDCIICEDDTFMMDKIDTKNINEICLLSGRLHHPNSWSKDKNFQKNIIDRIKFVEGVNKIDYNSYRWTGTDAIYYPSYKKALELYNNIVKTKRFKHIDILIANNRYINYLYYPSPFMMVDNNISQISKSNGSTYNYKRIKDVNVKNKLLELIKN